MPLTQSDVITDGEMKRLILALTRSGKPFTEEDVVRIVEWVAEIRIGEAMVALALKGRKSLFVQDGQVYCDENHAPWQPEEFA